MVNIGMNRKGPGGCQGIRAELQCAVIALTLLFSRTLFSYPF